MADHFDQYSIYSKIEFHIELSTKMFLVNKKGLHLLSEIRNKKYLKKRRNTPVFTESITKIYTNLVNILNYKMYVPRLYITLKHYLDESLFKDSENKYSEFYIDNKKYNLTRLYYDQDSWILNQDIQHYELDIDSELNITETMCLVCFLREYEEFLFIIEDYIRNTENYAFKKNIYKTIRRIRYKLNCIWDIVTNTISSSMSPRKN